jgi:hypothetical protein
MAVYFSREARLDTLHADGFTALQRRVELPE